MPAYDRRQFPGAAVKTTLSGNITAVATTITIAAATGWPTGAGNFLTVINRGNATEEKVLIASLSGTTLTVAASGRGYQGTTAAAHNTNETIECVFGSTDADEANQAVVATLGQITTNGDMIAAASPTTFGRVAAGTSGQVLVGGTPPAFTGSPSITALTTSGAVTASGVVTGTALAATGITGSALGARIIGGNASGVPGSGTQVARDTVVNTDGTIDVCTTGGSPGTFVNNTAALVAATGDILVGTGAKAIARLPIGTAGQVPTVSGGTLVYQTPASTFTQLARSVLGSNGLFSFTNISGAYNNLVIKGLVRSAGAVTTDSYYVRFNNDSGSNYAYQQLVADASSATAGQTNGVTAIAGTAHAIIGNSATANYASVFELWLPEYVATTFFKSCVITTGGNAASAVGANEMVGGTWASTVAVTRIDVGTAAGNFLTGSTLTLYGVA